MKHESFCPLFLLPLVEGSRAGLDLGEEFPQGPGLRASETSIGVRLYLDTMRVGERREARLSGEACDAATGIGA